MFKLEGRYNLKSPAVRQIDQQFPTDHHHRSFGWDLPTRVPVAQAISGRGHLSLYSSHPGEVPLYYHVSNAGIAWSESKLRLPKGATRLMPGHHLLWNPRETKIQEIDYPPLPDIAPPPSVEEAVAIYQTRLLAATEKRLQGRKIAAVAQSGGIDSGLIAWALHTLGVQVIPMCVCTALDDIDYNSAHHTFAQLGLNVLPMLVQPNKIESLLDEAIVTLEDYSDSLNLRMAIGNILIARQCVEMGIELCFFGHGQGDICGTGPRAASAAAAEQVQERDERWRNIRWNSLQSSKGMMKMFGSTLRKYGIETRMPYFDYDLVEWALSMPTSLFTTGNHKEFAYKVAHAALPPGQWSDPKCHIGYVSGAGMAKTSGFMQRGIAGLFEPSAIATRRRHLIG